MSGNFNSAVIEPVRSLLKNRALGRHWSGAFKLAACGTSGGAKL